MTFAASLSVTRIGDLSPADRSRVGEILRGTGHFREPEVDVALEVFDAAFGLGGVALDPDYRFIGARDDAGTLLGYACYGRTPQTDRSWDLYWIAVSAEAHGGGIGSQMLTEVERRVVETGARLLLIETSSRSDYTATREFYVRRGYTERARIRDFYAPDDDRVMLTKQFPVTA